MLIFRDQIHVCANQFAFLHIWLNIVVDEMEKINEEMDGIVERLAKVEKWMGLAKVENAKLRKFIYYNKYKKGWPPKREAKQNTRWMG